MKKRKIDYNTIKVRPGARLKCDPKLVADLAVELQDRELTSNERHDEAIRRAKPESSPFHKVFEWDDTLAAHEHRREQARLMFAAVVYRTYVEGEDNLDGEGDEDGFVPVLVKVDTNDGTDHGERHVHIKKVMDDAFLRQQLVDRARHDLENWVERYEMIVELAGAAKVVQDAILAIGKVSSKK